MPQLHSANFPVTEDGRTYHLDLAKGMIANRIITVGDIARAEKYAGFLDKDSITLRHQSARGFYTITGKYKGKDVSIVGIGMGFPMMDFLVREALYCFESGSTVAMLRLGTCGTPDISVQTGDYVITEDSISVIRNPDYFTLKEENQSTEGVKPYLLSLPVKSNKDFQDALDNAFTQLDLPHHRGRNAMGDSFYSSQGRHDDKFDDENDHIEGKLQELGVKSIEMESFQLLDLARCTKTVKVKACAATLVLAQRVTNVFIDVNLKNTREEMMGRAGLEAIINVEL
ncbi:predicted protein [Naegleria gruberi]|uniref:Predicted protein n=1 Tax=Naegleria gruberi TaxID=5762 RepID=D2UZ98_NAEGR|nr:uncharacterized protein NAEGRDRAFT_45426 [Naegleria gruberi]EFC49908.1 predicted protein [Naegleria gruberi]|eukprot:XP_002682652.1 predicted protein [Naegleria gruberi strain NEG-M]